MADIPERLIDKRILERNIAKGLVDQKTYDAHIEALPDVASNAEVVDLGGDGVAEEAPAEPEAPAGDGGAPPPPPSSPLY